MAQQTFAAAVQEVVEFVERALSGIEEGQSGDAELHNVQAYLLNLLELVERDEVVEAVCNDLYDAAAAVVARRSTADLAGLAMRRHLLEDAFRQFKAHLAQAHPSEKARHMGLT